MVVARTNTTNKENKKILTSTLKVTKECPHQNLKSENFGFWHCKDLYFVYI